MSLLSNNQLSTKSAIAGKASVLAVGTELTTGQITNRNAPWISEKLGALGIEVILHETVADDQKQIHEALSHCARHSQLIFVTGGLGPTTDDFTRNVISDWLGKPLQFDEPSWTRIIDRLTTFGIRVAESNRQQCFFPLGSQVIPNPDGTASGFTFRLTESQQQIWVLPGPPREVSAIWDQGIDSMIRELCPNLPRLKLFTWQCLGKSEAELGEITEEVLKGSELLIGYRAHRPFVEVKVWCNENEVGQKLHWMEKLEATLSPWIMTKQGADLAQLLLEHFRLREAVEIFDSATGGILANRLGEHLRTPPYQEQAKSLTLATEWAPLTSSDTWMKELLNQSDELCLTLALGSISEDGTVLIGLKEDGRVFQELLQSPYKKVELLERNRYLITELALKKWSEWMTLSTH